MSDLTHFSQWDHQHPRSTSIQQRNGERTSGYAPKHGSRWRYLRMNDFVFCEESEILAGHYRKSIEKRTACHHNDFYAAEWQPFLTQKSLHTEHDTTLVSHSAACRVLPALVLRAGRLSLTQVDFRRSFFFSEEVTWGQPRGLPVRYLRTVPVETNLSQEAHRGF